MLNTPADLFVVPYDLEYRAGKGLIGFQPMCLTRTPTGAWRCNGKSQQLYQEGHGAMWIQPPTIFACFTNTAWMLVISTHAPNPRTSAFTGSSMQPAECMGQSWGKDQSLARLGPQIDAEIRQEPQIRVCPAAGPLSNTL